MAYLPYALYPRERASPRGVPRLVFLTRVSQGTSRVREAYHGLLFCFLYPWKRAEFVRHTIACFPYALYPWKRAESARHTIACFPYALYPRERAEFARRTMAYFSVFCIPGNKPSSRGVPWLTFLMRSIPRNEPSSRGVLRPVFS